MPFVASMYRYMERQLDAWKSTENRKPLILKGLRQSGKTYLLTQWGERRFARCHYVNFEQMALAHRVFEGDLTPQRLVHELAFVLDTTVQAGTDLLILDEIQDCPRALTSLKYFREQHPTMAVAAAGSLLGLALHGGSFPVGKTEILSLHPMSFLEFLRALRDDRDADILEHCNLQTQISEVVHQRLWDRLRWYFVTGGLPEVVAAFIEAREDLPKAFVRVRDKQHQLLFAYYADFAKHAGKVNAMHIERVWRAVPQQLAATQDAAAKRFQFTGVVPGIDRYQRLAGAIDWLVAANLVLPAAITGSAEIPLMASCREKLFKLYACDVGLLGAMAGLPPKLLTAFQAGSYKGYFVENFAAQELTCAGDEGLVCWQQERSEVEFLRAVEGALVPLEVKSGHIVRAKSLQKFAARYRPPFCAVMSGKPLHVDAARAWHHYPLYLAGRFPLPS